MPRFSTKHLSRDDQLVFSLYVLSDRVRRVESVWLFLTGAANVALRSLVSGPGMKACGVLGVKLSHRTFAA